VADPPGILSPAGGTTGGGAWPPCPERAVRRSLSELVAATGVPASTIHHYRRSGLIPPPVRRAANRFAYDDRHVEAVRLIRVLRERRNLPLAEIGRLLPALLAGGDPFESGTGTAGTVGAPERGDVSVEVRDRLVEAAFAQFRSHTYEEVTVGVVADAAGVAKGSVYRYFASKDEMFTAVVEHLLAQLATGFAEAVETLGGPRGLAGDPERTAAVFATLVARSLPVFLEVGAWAAKGNRGSMILARQILRTLTDAVGGPLDPDAPTEAGLAVIESAFGTVLRWALEPEWPIGQ
jgi:AcrR family transcriptional regulator